MKVCAAKGFHRSGDGGTHSVDYGMTPIENYRETSLDSAGYPDLINVDHFKWDSTVITRLRSRAEEYKMRQLSVYTESERILAHLEHHARLNVESLHVGRGVSHYVRPTIDTVTKDKAS